jgi:8-oxo-dGTP pyrophosphatase MutT (NUDIX family)
VPLFGFLGWAAVAVAGEGRVKSNEIFLARPDTAAVVPVFDPSGAQAEAFLVREYRLAVRNPSGFVLEVPGGSSREAAVLPRAIALGELAEELGIVIDPARLVSIGSRQSAPTLVSHHTHLFGLLLTADEAAQLRLLASNGRVLGEDGEAGEERIHVVRQLLSDRFDASLDWASLGMLAEAIQVLDARQVSGASA